MHEFLVSVVAFIVLIGVMVVVHEFGHFIVAKYFKVRVESFSVGFGPRLFGIKYGDTDYKICLLPLGGFVKMTGESPEQNLEAPGTQTEVAVDDPGAFTSHPRWQRMLIGVAGPTANFILAFVLMLCYFSFFNEVPALKTTVVEWVTDGSAAARAGLQPGDTILRFGNLDNPSMVQIENRARKSPNQTVPVLVERGGNSLSLALNLPGKTSGKSFDLSQAGIFLQFVQSPIDVDQVVPNSPAAQAGLRSGDLIQSVDGHAFHSVAPLLAYLQTGQGKPVTLSVSRNGQNLAPLVVHPSIQDSEWRLGFSYVAPDDIATRIEPLPFTESVSEAKDFCVDNSTLIVQVLGRILTRKVAVSQLSGPVGIARMAGQAAEMKGWSPKFGLASAISLNLGILNLLPFPILDGGLIFLLLIESALRHDISVMVKERLFQAAFVLLMAFFAFVIFNDVTRLPIFTHLKP
ncbi:MAG: RIP metalloprotease RseP [Terracidiphilus sp.]|nr:RIP metalloprotease RseP [Terracidiphilus sp.]